MSSGVNMAKYTFGFWLLLLGFGLVFSEPPGTEEIMPKVPPPPLPTKHRLKLDAALLNKDGDACKPDLEIEFFDKISEASNGAEFDAIFDNPKFKSGKVVCNRFAGLECGHVWDASQNEIVNQCMCHRLHIWEPAHSKCALRKYRRCIPDKRKAYNTPGHFQVVVYSAYLSLQEYSSYLKCLDNTYCHPVTLSCVCYNGKTCPPDEDSAVRAEMQRKMEIYKKKSLRIENEKIHPHIATVGQYCNALTEDFYLPGYKKFETLDWELIQQFYEGVKHRPQYPSGQDKIYCNFLSHMDCDIDRKRAIGLLGYGKQKDDTDYEVDYQYEDPNYWKVFTDADYDKDKEDVKFEVDDPTAGPPTALNPAAKDEDEDVIDDVILQYDSAEAAAEEADVEYAEKKQEEQAELYEEELDFTGDFVDAAARFRAPRCMCKPGWQQVGEECHAPHLARCTHWFHHRNIWYEFEKTCYGDPDGLARHDGDCVRVGDMRKTDGETATGVCCAIYPAFHGGVCTKEKYPKSRKYRSKLQYFPYLQGVAIIRHPLNKTVNIDWKS